MHCRSSNQETSLDQVTLHEVSFAYPGSEEKVFTNKNLLIDTRKHVRINGAKNASNLSPGERKKIILVRTLMKPSQLLALDEPLNHLDAQGIEGFFAACAEDRRTMLVVSHRDFKQCDELWTEITLDS